MNRRAEQVGGVAERIGKSGPCRANVSSAGEHLCIGYYDLSEGCLLASRVALAAFRFYVASGSFPPMSTENTKTTTIVMKAFQGENEKLVSRAQAKSLVAGFGEANIVVLDFAGVDEIGQGFADELLRVFRNANRNIELNPINMSASVAQMISRVQAADKM